MFDKLTRQLGEYFIEVEDHRRSNSSYEVSDSLKGAYAMFSLKSPSLLAFREENECEVRQHNLKTVYGLKQIPGDTALRETIDEIAPKGPAKNNFPILIRRNGHIIPMR